MIETDRLILKKLDINDAQDMFKYMNDYETTKYLFRGSHKSIDDTIKYIENAKNSKDIDLLGVFLKENNKLIGHLAMLFEPVNDILWAFNKEYQGKGYAYEASKTFIKYIFEKYNLEVIDGHADIRNIPSIKLMEKLNMERTTISERIYPDERGSSKEIGFILKKCYV